MFADFKGNVGFVGALRDARGMPLLALDGSEGSRILAEPFDYHGICNVEA